LVEIKAHEKFYRLFKLLEQAKQAKTNLLLSTACRCHGVVSVWNFLDE
jgi:hypothetical protein